MATATKGAAPSSSVPATDRTMLVFPKDDPERPVLGRWIAGLNGWSWHGNMHPHDDVDWWCEIPKKPK